MSEIFDFGFTAVDEKELDLVQYKQNEVEDAKMESASMEDRLNTLYNAIMPLLSNLKKNPEKEYILWPDRLTKVEAFEDHLQKIYKG